MPFLSSLNNLLYDVYKMYVVFFKTMLIILRQSTMLILYPFSIPEPDPNPNCNSNTNSNPNLDLKPIPNSAGVENPFFLNSDKKIIKLYQGSKNLG